MPDKTQKKSSLYFFYGEDTYSIAKKVQFWVENFKAKYDESNIEIVEGKHIDLKEFATNLTSMPFLSDKRLVIVENFLEGADTDTQKEMVEILNTELPDFCILVFTENKMPDKRTSLFKTLCKLGTTEEFKPMSPYELTRWITEETKKRGGKIANTEADFLGQHVGPNLWQLSNEIDKLISATENSQTINKETTNQPSTSLEPKNSPSPITKALILDLVTPSLSSSIFKLTDALAVKDRTTSLKIFSILVASGEEALMIFYMIVRHFRILIQTKYLVDTGTTDQTSIARELKCHPFVAMNSAKQCRNFDMPTLKKIYAELLELDKSFKSGRVKITADDQSEMLFEIERFIIKNCG